MKNVLILGATSDIAKALAIQFAQEGYALILAARDAEQRLSSISNDLQIRYEISVSIAEFDALNFNAHKKFYSSLAFSPDIVICAFGLLGEQNRALDNFQITKEVIDSNYVGSVSILNIIANDFIEKREGTIVCISSVAGDRGRQSNFIYGSAKAGLTSYLSGLRNWLYSYDVHVMTVKPGFVDTKMTEDIKLHPLLTAQPDYVAKVIYDGILKKKDVIYTRWFWRWIMWIICLIPESFFKRLKL